MMESGLSQFGDHSVEGALFDALTRGDAAMASAGPILRHMLENDDHSMFTDEIVARVRGMVSHVARQLLARGERVVGIDNLNDYYDVQLKRDRLADIAHPHFAFHQADFADHVSLEDALRGVEIDTIVRHTKPDAWVGNPIKERKVKNAIRANLGADFDQAKLDELFELVKARHEYS